MIALVLLLALADGGADGGVDGPPAVAAPPAVAPSPSAPPPTGTTSRLVLERGTRRPLPGAAATLDLLPAGETDEEGRLSLTAPCGRHHLVIQQPGYEVVAL